MCQILTVSHIRSWQKFYTTAGRNDGDESHLWDDATKGQPPSNSASERQPIVL